MPPTDGLPDPSSPGLFSGFGAFGVIALVVAIAMAAIFVLLVVKGIVLPGIKYATSHDEQTPARLVTRRTNVSGGVGDTGASTSYYATFEFPSGERREFRVRGRAYGLMVEGDEGTLTFRGDICQRFDRTMPVRSAASAGQALPPVATPPVGEPRVTPPGSSPHPAPVSRPAGDGRRPGDAWTN